MNLKPYNLKVGDKIITREDNESPWNLNIFSHHIKNLIYTVNGVFNVENVCNLEGFEYLLGKIEEPHNFNIGDVVSDGKRTYIFKEINWLGNFINIEKDVHTPIFVDIKSLRFATQEEIIQHYNKLNRRGLYFDHIKKAMENFDCRVNPNIKIIDINDDAIIFDDDSQITYDHDYDCCEHNYADFSQLEDLAKETVFDRDLSFEACSGGFRFGNPGKMFYIPCYSEQNGYYTTEIDIYYNKNRMLRFNAQEKFI